MPCPAGQPWQPLDRPAPPPLPAAAPSRPDPASTRVAPGQELKRCRPGSGCDGPVPFPRPAGAGGFAGCRAPHATPSVPPTATDGEQERQVPGQGVGLLSFRLASPHLIISSPPHDARPVAAIHDSKSRRPSVDCSQGARQGGAAAFSRSRGGDSLKAVWLIQSGKAGGDPRRPATATSG